jgi:DNA polymerase-3 subunit beta
MKISVLKEDIEKLVKNAYRFASNRSQLPILENLVFRTNKTKLIILATNLEISFNGSIGAKVDEEGEISIPANIMLELVSKINSEKINFETDGEVVKVSANNFNAEIAGMNTSDFPTIPDTGGKQTFKIDLAKFCSGLNKVMFSVSRDETRPVLTGVLTYFDTQYLYFVSSDGFRLSQKKIKFDGKSVISDNLIIPKMIFLEILRMKDVGEFLEVSYEKEQSQVIFRLGDCVLSSRLIEGSFPDFSKIIPKEVKTTVEVEKKDLSEVISTAGIFARDSANVIKIDISNDMVKVLSESAKSGKQESQVEAKVDGVDQLVSFNFHFIEEFLGAVEKGVRIKLNDSNSAGVFEDIGDADYLHIIMPVRMED